METLVTDAPFLNFLAIVCVAIISGYFGVQIKKLDKRNTVQHEQGRVERKRELEDATTKLSGKLDLIHDDLRENTIEIAVLGEKLDTHIHDRNLHEHSY